ncbi:MAG: hypothetical protein ACOCXQ_04775 [Patescibacteria group bacterium]
MKIVVPIPEEADVLIKKGDTVDFDTPFITNITVEEVKISLASNLGFEPDKIFMYLHKFVGDEIKKDELLAEKKAFLSTKQYVSEFHGTVKEINHYDGSITLEKKREGSVATNCYFQGKVEEIEKDKLILKVKHASEFLLRDEAPAFGGPTLYYDLVTSDDLTEEKIAGKVIIAEKLATFDIVKFEALGATGFVTLQPPEEETITPIAVVKQIKDFENMKKQVFSCCIIGPEHTTIYLYD